MKKIKLPGRNITAALVLLLISVGLIAAVLIKERELPVDIAYQEFMALLEEQKIEHVLLSDQAKIRFTIGDDAGVYTTDNPRNAQFKEFLLLKGVSVGESKGSIAVNAAQSIFSLAMVGGAVFFVYRLNLKHGGKSALAMPVGNMEEQAKYHLRFTDVAGNTEAKESVADVVDFIRNPEKYARYGARMPRGIIFYGQPGTGKTLMAKAIAGEAGVTFYSVSGSDFVQMYVGVGASRVRELFRKAREAQKAVIFIDEIDALGKKRSASPVGGNDERDQTLNALLTEMSGFSDRDGIVVIAATNRLDTLDEALLRPGRFDRQIEIGLPDCKAREDILQLHGANKPLGTEVDLHQLAKETVYFSGAMLENLLNEAAIFAAKENVPLIRQDDIEKAYYTVIAGSEKKDRSGFKDRDRQITAYHESGHALAAKLVSPENLVSKITIIPTTKGAGGFCINIPPDKMYYTKKELENQVVVHLAGRAAEELVFGADHVTTGAGNDIEKATALLRDYIAVYGMGDATGLIHVQTLKGADHIMEECKELMEQLYNRTKKLLADYRETLERIAAALLEQETLREEDLDLLIS